MGHSFRLAASFIYIYASSLCYTSPGALAGGEITQWVYLQKENVTKQRFVHDSLSSGSYDRAATRVISLPLNSPSPG